MRVCVRVRVHVRVRVCVHVCVRVCVHVCMCVCARFFLNAEYTLNIDGFTSFQRYTSGNFPDGPYALGLTVEYSAIRPRLMLGTAAWKLGVGAYL